MGEQNYDLEQDRPVMEKPTPSLLQQQKQHLGIAKEAARTTTTTALDASAELHTIATKQITENSGCISGSAPLPFVNTSPPDNSDAVPSLTKNTNTSAVADSSPTGMEGVIEGEITLLQIQQTRPMGDNTATSLLDAASPIQARFPSNSGATLFTDTQSKVLPKECNVTWPQTPESVVQEQKQEQEQSELMDEDVIMEEITETCPPALSTSQETPLGANHHILEPSNDEMKEINQPGMDDSNSESDQDDDNCNDNDDDEEAPSDKKGKARGSSSSSSHPIPREPTILSFDDAVYSAVPVSSELYIIPFCSKGFNWNADLFLKPHQRRNLGLDDLYRTLSTESRISSSGSSSSTTSATTSSNDGLTDAASVDSRPSSSGVASNNGHSHGSAIHVHEIWLSDLDTATILPA
ncbi:hypothetical protein EMPS_08623 [Entomortierella parvispora]|uniref:Uncharacterized protein n=1 Tax=Entomortierella parvispora TaxID=205924 RepID=A0A9P3HGC7_9FUNG|nr:hypothetical protein EMPS_08623 [Entomortierella parvispora]